MKSDMSRGLGLIEWVDPTMEALMLLNIGVFLSLVFVGQYEFRARNFRDARLMAAFSVIAAVTFMTLVTMA